MNLVSAQIESSISPPFDYHYDIDTGEPAAPSTPGASNPLSSVTGGIKRLFLSIIRPKVTISSDLLGSQVNAPYGDPFPWQIGFILMLLGVVYIGHTLWTVGRRIGTKVG